nr:AraC family transcriptional regulator [Paenarthrobacter ureafaciens]
MVGADIQTSKVNDVDLHVEFGKRFFYDYAVEPMRQSSAFTADLSAGTFGPITVGLLKYGTEVRGKVDGNEDAYGVHIPVGGGGFEALIGRSTFAAAPGEALLIGPLGEMRFSGWGREDDQALLLKIDRDSMETQLRSMLGGKAQKPVRFDPSLNLQRGLGAQWAKLLQPISESFHEPNDLAWNPFVRAHVANSLVSGLLVATNHNYREQLESGGQEMLPAFVRRAAAYIEEHADEPITIPEVAAAMGCNIRSLQRGFARHLNTTPTLYLRRVRMDFAHRDLMLGSPETTTVSEIASRWGFWHLSRFASGYRDLYGNSPLHTLRRLY